jgi:hypothetical protein
MSGIATSFAGLDVQHEKVEFSDRDMADNITDNPANLELELQKVQQELAAALGVIEQVQKSFQRTVLCPMICFETLYVLPGKG